MKDEKILEEPPTATTIHIRSILDLISLPLLDTTMELHNRLEYITIWLPSNSMKEERVGDIDMISQSLRSPIILHGIIMGRDGKNTNYWEIVRRERNILVALLIKYINVWVVHIHCHKVIRLSAATQDVPRSVVCNVHGVNPKFLDIGLKTREKR